MKNETENKDLTHDIGPNHCQIQKMQRDKEHH